MFLARTFGANQNLLDVDRVEILRGPQGTLFGRNTIGGAINIVTHVPGTEPRFEAQATVGDYNRTDLGFTADLPITDTLLSSLTVSSIDRDGYQEVIPYPADSPWGSTPSIVDPMNAYPRAGFDTSDANGGLNQTVVRGKLQWLASDDVEVTLAADWQHQDQPSTPATVLSVNTGHRQSFSAPSTTPASARRRTCSTRRVPPHRISSRPAMHTGEWGICGPRADRHSGAGRHRRRGPRWRRVRRRTGRRLRRCRRTRGSTGTSRATETGDIDKTYANGVSFAKNDGWGISLTADWEIGEDLTLKSITGYREIDWRSESTSTARPSRSRK